MTDVNLPYANRVEAGNILAEQLEEYAGLDAPNDETIVLALPRGGVPVAAVIADRLGAALDLILVRKLGLPGYEELAMGAIASGNTRVLNKDVLSLHQVTEQAIDRVATREGKELHRREEAYRGNRPFPELVNRRVILVDDGLATGATMRAAIQVVHKKDPREIILAVPVAPISAIEALQDEVDRVVCPATPEPFMAIGRWYQDFGQTSDEEVRQLLSTAWRHD